MSQKGNKTEDRGQTTENKQKPRVSKLAVVAMILGLVSLIALLLREPGGWCGTGRVALMEKVLVLRVLAITAIIMAAIAITRIQPARKRGYVYAIFGIVCAVVSFAGPRHSGRGIMCGTNLSGLGKAILVYANDNNDEFPTTERWCDLLVRYVDAHPKQFICRQSDTKFGESSYAMNINLSGKKTGEIPLDTVLLFETDLGKDPDGRMDSLASRDFFDFLKLPGKKGKQKIYGKRWNQYGGQELLTLEHHESRGCNILFADSHVEFIKAEDINNLLWE